MTSTNLKISQAIDEFLIDQKVRGNSPKTVDYYKGAFHIFDMFYSVDNDIQSINLPLLRKYTLFLQERGISTTSIQSYVRALRAFLTWCFNEDILPDNLSEKYKLPKAKRKQIDVLTDDEINRLLSCFNLSVTFQLRNYCICALMLDSGLRMEEVTTLRLSNLHLQDGYIIVDGKGNKQRFVPVGLKNRKNLLRYIRKRKPAVNTDFVFLMSSGQPITNNTIKQLFRKLKKRTGISRLRAHLLRHTFATKYIERGGDIYSLREILGHTSLEMVKRYVHITHQKQVKDFTSFSPLDNFGR